jgi:hypothetical protein
VVTWFPSGNEDSAILSDYCTGYCLHGMDNLEGIETKVAQGGFVFLWRWANNKGPTFQDNKQDNHHRKRTIQTQNGQG